MCHLCSLSFDTLCFTWILTVHVVGRDQVDKSMVTGRNSDV
jgi:hypothetical protein